MKTKAALSIQICHTPATHDRYMILWQAGENGMVFTDHNEGKGYTPEEASAKARKIREEFNSK